MRFYPKTEKYKFINLPQNNRSKRRSTRVGHVSEVRFEIESLDLRGFEKSLKTLLSSLFLSVLVFSFSTEKGAPPFSFLSFIFYKVRRQCEPLYIYLIVIIFISLFLYFLFFLFSLHFLITLN
jgi:hypothetical protein